MKNLHFILDYINKNPGSTHTTIRKALCEHVGIPWMRSYANANNGDPRPTAHYTWYFSESCSYGQKKGIDYGYYTKENGEYHLTEKGKNRLALYESKV